MTNLSPQLLTCFRCVTLFIYIITNFSPILYLNLFLLFMKSVSIFIHKRWRTFLSLCGRKYHTKLFLRSKIVHFLKFQNNVCHRFEIADLQHKKNTIWYVVFLILIMLLTIKKIKPNKVIIPNAI